MPPKIIITILKQKTKFCSRFATTKQGGQKNHNEKKN